MLTCKGSKNNTTLIFHLLQYHCFYLSQYTLLILYSTALFEYFYVNICEITVNLLISNVYLL